MEPCDSLGARCVATMRCLVAEEQWDCSAAELAVLAARACDYLDTKSTDTQVRTVLVNLHHDHRLVEALRSGDIACHEEEWKAWFGQVRAILHHAGRDWTHDDAVDFDDLAQVALIALLRSLPGYRYASRFSTWAYQVILRGAQRHLRDLAAKKRVVTLDRSVDLLTLTLSDPIADSPEKQVMAHTLEAMVANELTRVMGERNSQVFQLWARDDLSAEMIGRRVHLSTARVHAIIAKARTHLRRQTDFQHWYEGGV